MRFACAQAAALTTILLAGCSTYQTSFQCPVPETGKCKSVQQAYAAATAKSPMPVPIDPDRLASPPAAGDWQPPVKTVWIAPYVDNSGRRHEASLLRIVVFPGATTPKNEPEYLVPPVPDTADDGTILTSPQPPVPNDDVKGGLPKKATSPLPMPGNSRSSLGIKPPAGGAGAGFSIPGF